MKIFGKKIEWTIIVFWLGVITLFLWLLAKTLGWINTPLIIEILPLISGLVILLSGMRHAGKFIHRVENGLSDIKDLKERVGNLEIKLDNSVNSLRADIHNLDKRVAIIESRI